HCVHHRPVHRMSCRLALHWSDLCQPNRQLLWLPLPLVAIHSACLLHACSLRCSAASFGFSAA
ncbi:unnamed protein product, partial [Closterium sp. Naga37s-1]